MSKKLKILCVSSEVTPYAKTGGLADVAGSLPQALALKGHDVRVVMPGYAVIENRDNYITDFCVDMAGRVETCIVKGTKTDIKGSNKKVPVYFLNSYHYYERDGIYCYMDDGERFIFMCRAALDMLPKIDFKPDIIHCNDWHTGPITFMLKNLEQYLENDFYKDIATVFTIHNLQYQGNFSSDILRFMNVDYSYFISGELEFYGQFSFMKTGITYADIITTVSETYAKEILTPLFGELLEGNLRIRKDDLYGIVNGISEDYFNPKTDSMIYKNYDLKNIVVKRENKSRLQEEIGLPISDAPLFSIVTRLVDQKGLDLVLALSDYLLSQNVQMVVLGLGNPYYEDAFRIMEEKYPKKVRAFIEFNEPLAHKIYAGSDIFLMPSKFEPCGLGQLISLKYGTIPIVRRTGGLADTIFEYDAKKKSGNGFLFEDLAPESLKAAIKRCLEVYDKTPIWNELVRLAISSKFSWEAQAEKYISVFNVAIDKKIANKNVGRGIS